MRCHVVMLGVLLVPAVAFSQQPLEDGDVTVIYFVRHAEVDPTQPTFPLSAAGRLKAEALARAVSEVRFTHVFSSHTTRAREMVEPVAFARNIPVQQLPQPGARPDSTVVSDRTSSRAAIEPLVHALRQLPAGSRALVGVNSDNVYAILNGLGVPEGSAEQPCLSGRTCVPCLTNACASPRYDQLWLLILRRETPAPTLIELRYGATGAH
ncbi:MAG TPA: histidine phosphatase family protein [Gemmatimonadaceae bacterium]